MTPFHAGEISQIRQMLGLRKPMAKICARWVAHTRDELVEAIDAIHRHENNQDAADHVNRVLDCQAQGIPLINGWPAFEVLDGINPLGSIRIGSRADFDSTISPWR